MNANKQNEYAKKAIGCLGLLLDENSPYYIDIDDITKNSNDFIYAVGAMAPGIFISQLTGQNESAISFNHLINSLIVQNASEGNMNLVDKIK